MNLVDSYDELIVALCVWREARGEDYEAKVAVASVIRNRQKDLRWPSTLSEVVLQPLQFSSFNANDPNAVRLPRRSRFADWSAFEECCRAVSESASRDAADGANHYHDTSIPPPHWTAQMKHVKQVGKLVFYKG